MRIPAWSVYSVLLIVILAVLFFQEAQDTAPVLPMPYEIAEPVDPPEGPPLPGADPFDELILVQVGDAEDGIGTAFAINKSGAWLTARHVVEGCGKVGLSVGDGRVVRVDAVRTSPTSDLALIITDRAPAALKLDLDRELRIGEVGYHIGFPQGRSGEARSELQARSRLLTRGRYVTEENVLAWGEKARSDGIGGTLSGMSGGPVFDAKGAVVGVTVAESPGRGRIYAAGPETIGRFLDEQGLLASGDNPRPIEEASYVREADRLRSQQAIVKVLCRVSRT